MLAASLTIFPAPSRSAFPKATASAIVGGFFGRSPLDREPSAVRAFVAAAALASPDLASPDLASTGLACGGLAWGGLAWGGLDAWRRCGVVGAAGEPIGFFLRRRLRQRDEGGRRFRLLEEPLEKPRGAAATPAGGCGRRLPRSRGRETAGGDHHPQHPTRPPQRTARWTRRSERRRGWGVCVRHQGLRTEAGAFDPCRGYRPQHGADRCIGKQRQRVAAGCLHDAIVAD